MSKSQKQAEPTYEISEMNLVNALTTGAKYFKQGQGFDILEADGPRGGYWIVDHRGPKWWVPGTSVGSCKYEPKKSPEPVEAIPRSELADAVR